MPSPAGERVTAARSGEALAARQPHGQGSENRQTGVPGRRRVLPCASLLAHATLKRSRAFRAVRRLNPRMPQRALPRRRPRRRSGTTRGGACGARRAELVERERRREQPALVFVAAAAQQEAALRPVSTPSAITQAERAAEP